MNHLSFQAEARTHTLTQVIWASLTHSSAHQAGSLGRRRIQDTTWTLHRAQDCKNAVRSPELIWGQNLREATTIESPGRHPLRQPVDHWSRLFPFAESRKSLRSGRSGGSPAPWRSCVSETVLRWPTPHGSLSLSLLLPPTGCLDVLLWAGTLAESAVHLCKWQSQHPFPSFRSHSNRGVVL